MVFYLMYLLAIICSHQLTISLKGLKFGLRFHLHPFSACANSKGFGETACTLRYVILSSRGGVAVYKERKKVREFTDRICQLKHVPIWIPVLSWAFVSIMNLLRGKLTYCAYEKKTNEPAHGKLVLITKIPNEDIDVHLCMLIEVSLNMNVIVRIH